MDTKERMDLIMDYERPSDRILAELYKSQDNQQPQSTDLEQAPDYDDIDHDRASMYHMLWILFFALEVLLVDLVPMVWSFIILGLVMFSVFISASKGKHHTLLRFLAKLLVSLVLAIGYVTHLGDLPFGIGFPLILALSILITLYIFFRVKYY